MESHIRVKCSAIRTAIQQLECSTFKVLMTLASYTNQYAICFPTPKRIADDANMCAKTVYSALDELEMYGYIKYLRRAYYNRFTNESTHAIFQVNPHFMEIADEFFPDALRMWQENGKGIFFLSNQQQEPTSVNNDSIQRQETTTTNNNRDSEKESATAKSEPTKTTAQQTNSAPQQKRESSAIVKKYTNPILITSELEALQESLAVKLSELEIKISLARGFIVEYGYAQCEIAHRHLQFLLTKQKIENPSGFYRYLLQSNMANVLPSMNVKDRDYSGGQYSHFVES